MLKRIFLAAVVLAAVPSYATVDVAFVNPEKFADASNQRWEMQGTLDAIAQHMKRTGDRYIAPNETLKIEVLDLDLAGWARFAGRAPNDSRVVRGGADFPTMKLRYTLQSPQGAKSGEADLSDMTYQNHGLTTRGASEPYYYEKRMIDDWFRSTFAQRSP
ncbi:MAG TPA: DUF3016 domain-containing protein [Usitatibacter sp.]|jgi:hypothetical protein|nr:DUF3016 domain-containing protein [Usitatibacter sp.]